MNIDLDNKWGAKTKSLTDRYTADEKLYGDFAEANIKSIQQSHKELHVVVNISAAHIPNLFARSISGKRPVYLNCYDLGIRNAHIGEEIPNDTWRTREIVDHALETIHGQKKENIYFMAVDLNGTGVRFYGDICIVLKDIDSNTVVLDRNSFDMIRDPLSDQLTQARSEVEKHKILCGRAIELAGHWGTSLDSIIAVKVLTITGERDRLLTLGQISNGILDDEDYIEVLKIGSFAIEDIERIRLSSNDVALENYIYNRNRTGYPPSAAEQLWLMQRQEALYTFNRYRVKVVVATVSGRTKT